MMRLALATALALSVLTLSLPSAVSSRAQQPSPAAPAPTAPAETASAQATSPGAHPLTAADLETWLDGLIPYAVERGDVAGAVVVVVSDGAILFQRGYGYADVESQTPVDPETTLFRPGSVSKLFTWTAVMQMVEQGKVDLDADVNTYLDFQIPGPPITLRNLMTHTGGFQESIKNVATETETGVSLAERMRWIPDRIFAPGTTPAYSNYGTGLAGYIVERVSGESFEDYMQRHVLQPLGMNHSTFHQPLPENLQPHMSSGYTQGSTREPRYFELVGVNPAGGLAASGADMGRFMLAHLQNGALGDARILQATTAEQMHTTAYDGVPNVHHMLLGFYQRDINGRRVIAHGGDLNFFHSELSLFLDDGIGVFISMNSSGNQSGAGAIRSALFEEFADRYLPGPQPDGEVDAATAAQHAQMIAGHYEASRRWQSGILSAFSVLGQTTIAPTEDGSILVSGMSDRNGAPTRWKEIAPFVWRQADGHWRLAAQVEDGQVVRVALDEAPFQVFERAPWYRSSSLVVPAFGFSLALIAIAALFWPVTAFTRWRYKSSFPHTGAQALGYRGVRVSAILVIAAVVAWIMLVSTMLSTIGDLLSNKSDGIVIPMRIGSLIIFAGAAIVALWNAYLAWANPRSWWSKLWSTLLALAFLAALGCAYVFGFIGFTAMY